MKINLNHTELNLAITEYVTRRGLDPEKIKDITIIAGRKGNGNTAVLDLQLPERITLPDTVQVYAGVNTELNDKAEEIEKTKEFVDRQHDLKLEEPVAVEEPPEVTPEVTEEPETVEVVPATESKGIFGNATKGLFSKAR